MYCPLNRNVNDHYNHNYILQTLDQFAIACSGYLSYPLFFVKREISYEVTTFSADGFFRGGSLPSG